MSLLLLFAGARIQRGYVDDAGTSDALRVTLRRRYVDTAGTSDVLRQSMVLRRKFTDAAGASDVLRRSLARRWSLTDDAGASDSLDITRDYRRRLVDDTGSTDDGRLNGGPLFGDSFGSWFGAELGNDTITIRNAPMVTDPRYGKQRRDWTGSTSVSVPRCSVQPFSAAEVVADREFTNTHVRLFAPPGVALTAASRVVFGGVTYEVDGEPGAWRDLDGRPSHIEATLKRVGG